MAVSVFVFLLAVGAVSGTSHSQAGRKQQDKKSPMLTERVDQLEHLLSEQAAKLSIQETALERQAKKLAHQEKLLRQQGSTVRQQNSLLDRQNAKLSQQESLIRKQDTKLAGLESLLRQVGAKVSSQESLLRQVGAKVSSQESLLRKQDAKLSSQERELRQQDTKLSNLENLLRQHDVTTSLLKSRLRQQDVKLSKQERLLFRQGRIMQQLKAANLENPDANHEMAQTKGSHPQENTDYTKNAAFSERKEMAIASATHDVIPRSDDVEGWESVVSHISQQVTEMSADIQTVKNTNAQQDRDIQDAQTSTFVHWGSSQCGGSSQLVYSGVVGGSWYEHTGAATNYLCLTMSPVFSDHSIPPYLAYLYGAEYQTYDSHNQKDAVCAVCCSTFSTTIMIPGTNACSPGWHLQYSGFLMAGNHNDPAGSEYICVDSQLENSNHGDADQNGKLLFYTVTQCGSLPCSPYVNNKVVTCAVCSK